MGSDWEIIGKEGLQFFGKMSASITHEIKNVLAIINENAGLLEDFTLMAEKGRPIEMERFKTVAGKIKNQVRRADGIVKNLSRFAHSADAFTEEIDLNEVLKFVVSLSGRLADMQGIALEQMHADRPVMVTTTPFCLQNLLCLCLDFAMEVTGTEKNIHLSAEKMENGAQIRFSHLRDMEKIPGDRFPTQKEKALMGAIGARLSIDPGGGELRLMLRGDIEN